MRSTLCLIFALALTACGGSDDAPAKAAAHSEPAAAAAPAESADENAAEVGGEEEAAAAADGAEVAEADEGAEGAEADEGAEAAEAAAPAGDVEAGKIVYNTFCMACHQLDGKGMNGALGANFVEDKTRLAKTDEQLLNSIANGVPGTTMIAWGGQLDETKRKNVLAYIRATFGQ
jgi:mono/diheme cytochrome c family protein